MSRQVVIVSMPYTELAKLLGIKSRIVRVIDCANTHFTDQVVIEVEGAGLPEVHSGRYAADLKQQWQLEEVIAEEKRQEEAIP